MIVYLDQQDVLVHINLQDLEQQTFSVGGMSVAYLGILLFSADNRPYQLVPLCFCYSCFSLVGKLVRSLNGLRSPAPSMLSNHFKTFFYNT
jgi:hypothetical protein